MQQYIPIKKYDFILVREIGITGTNISLFRVAVLNIWYPHERERMNTIITNDFIT